MLAVALTAATALATVVYMLADKSNYRPMKAVAKMTAATSFCALAVVNGALSTTYGTVLLAGLVLSWLGDAALLWRNERVFLLGLVAFLLAHLAYGAAFIVRGIDTNWSAVAAVLLAIVVATAGRWFMNKAPAKLKIPVIAYVSVIGAMVSLAAGVLPSAGGKLVFGAAVAFMVSDVFVGLDRFVRTGWQTRWWGTPLYFGGQAAFAWTVVG